MSIFRVGDVLESIEHNFTRIIADVYVNNNRTWIRLVDTNGVFTASHSEDNTHRNFIRKTPKELDLGGRLLFLKLEYNLDLMKAIVND